MDFAKGYGAKGLAYLAVQEDGSLKSSFAKLDVYKRQVQEYSGALFPRSAAAKFRKNAKLHEEAFSVLSFVDNRQSQADILPVLAKKQIVAAVLFPVVQPLNLCLILRIIQKVGQIFIFRVGKNISPVISVELIDVYKRQAVNLAVRSAAPNNSYSRADDSAAAFSANSRVLSFCFSIELASMTRRP